MPPGALDLSSSPNVPPTSQQILVGTEDDASFPEALSFKCAVTDSKGPRRFMEDSHSVVVPFAGIHGQGFFAIFDGHAGKHAAEWCGHNFSLCLLNALRAYPNDGIPDVLNQAFHDVDNALTRISEESDGKMHSGCTAVTAFLRLEDSEGKQSFLPPGYDALAYAAELIEEAGDEESSTSDSPTSPTSLKSESPSKDGKHKKAASKLKNAIRHFVHSSHSRQGSQSSTVLAEATPSSDAVSKESKDSSSKKSQNQNKPPAFTPKPSLNIRRVLYCANAGDARGVLCRAGKAVRLTYDHKGSDKQEAKRITDSGGFVMGGRVNGVLAVTRSLGDSSMKEFVVGAPYTTETELTEEDEFLILACDGLWDVVEDQAATDLVRAIVDPKEAAQELLDHAYRNYSSDNVTVLVVRFRNPPKNTRSQ